MNETYEFLMGCMQENWLHARLCEEKRATTANLVIVLATAVQAMLLLTGINRKALALTMLLMVLGLYGLLASAKLYERSQFHIRRARRLRARLDELLPDAQVQPLQSIAEEEHTAHYPVLSQVRLNTIWLGMHLLVVILGVVDTIICFGG
ncbi:MAG: hypothetical protein JO125_05740 [Chloroflexi bacterium]|nr:hypothetical protein [Ktedonobacteraceae bacterium]MBV9706888.1 hypothetical protein [Chloroflexota bacterium]